MRWAAVTALVALLGLSLAVSLFLYLQRDTKTVVIAEAAELQPDGTGALCGNVQFKLPARTLGLWAFSMKKGQQAAGTISVAGSEAGDIGLRVWSPGNRLVLDRPVPQHRQPFQIVAAIGGDYLFEFDNRHSVFTSKHMTVSVCVT